MPQSLGLDILRSKCYSMIHCSTPFNYRATAFAWTLSYLPMFVPHMSSVGENALEAWKYYTYGDWVNGYWCQSKIY